MTLGELARKLLGDKAFQRVGRLYRGLAVDLGVVSDGLPKPPAGSHVLEVGSGDGDFMNYYLARNPGVHATMIDIAPRVGGWLSPEFRGRVEILPETSVADLTRLGRGPFDLIILSDVVHHVPTADRPKLFHDIHALIGSASTQLAIKDVEPDGSFRAKALFLADRYVSGDARVAFVPRDEMVNLVRASFPGADFAETDLRLRNPPNYCLVFSIRG